MGLTRENWVTLIEWMGQQVKDDEAGKLLAGYLEEFNGDEHLTVELVARAAVIATTPKGAKMPLPFEFRDFILDALGEQAPPERPKAPQEVPPDPPRRPARAEGVLDTCLPDWKSKTYQEIAAKLSTLMPTFNRDERIRACREMESRWPGKGWGDEAEAEALRR